MTKSMVDPPEHDGNKKQGKEHRRYPIMGEWYFSFDGDPYAVSTSMDGLSKCDTCLYYSDLRKDVHQAINDHWI